MLGSGLPYGLVTAWATRPVGMSSPCVNHMSVGLRMTSIITSCWLALPIAGCASPMLAPS